MSEEGVISLYQEQEEEQLGERSRWDHLSASLHYIHAPKMSDAGLITYHGHDGVYRYHRNEQLETYLDLAESERDPGNCSPVLTTARGPSMLRPQGRQRGFQIPHVRTTTHGRWA